MKVIHSIVALTLIAAASEAQARTEVCHTTNEMQIAALCKQVDLAADGVDAGVYTFTYGWNGKEWLTTSHHSFVMPEPVKQ